MVIMIYNNFIILSLLLYNKQQQQRKKDQKNAKTDKINDNIYFIDIYIFLFLSIKKVEFE